MDSQPPPVQPPPAQYPPTQYPPPPPPRSGIPVWAWLLIGCGCFAVFGVLILAAILFPVFAQAREAARAASCMSNVKQLNLGVLMYEQDYDMMLPRGRQWMDDIQPYNKSETTYHCPSVRPPDGSVYGYAFNSKLSGASAQAMTNPALEQMIYDSSNLARNATDPVSSLPNPPRHRGSSTMGYADGHVRMLRASTSD